MMTHNREFHKAEMVFQELERFVDQACEDGLRADQTERGLLVLLFQLGRELVDVSISRCGNGDLGPTIEENGRTLKRLDHKRQRRYVSVFGEHAFEQYVYAVREDQKIERRPVDQQLGLPASEHSYVLQDWLQRFCIKESFEEASSSLEAILGLSLPVSTAERMNLSLIHI